MKELLAEIEQVNAVIEDLEEEIKRKKKMVNENKARVWDDIKKFLWDMDDLLCKAGAETQVIVNTGVVSFDVRPIGLVFYGNKRYKFVELGLYSWYVDGYDHEEHECVSESMKVEFGTGLKKHKTQDELIKVWNDETEGKIRSVVIAKARQILEERMKKMQLKLNEANAECVQYVEEERARITQGMRITVGHVIDNPTFDFCGRYEITTTENDGTVNVLYDSERDMEQDIPDELLIEPITYMVVNTSNGRLRIEVR
jgi:hypothetical protein